MYGNATIILRTFCSRPRSLYASIFVWLAIGGGRFLAPFLEHEANLSSLDIGMLLSLHQFISVLTSFQAGIIGDKMEKWNNNNNNEKGGGCGGGRAIVLIIAVTIGSLVVLLHGFGHFLRMIGIIPVNYDDDDDGDENNDNTNDTNDFSTKVFFDSLYWYGFLRILSSISSSFDFPILDAICLDYLKSNRNRSNQDYGKERLYGAISWAIINSLLGFVLDITNGNFALIVYPATIVSTILVWIVVYIYWKLNNNNDNNNDNNNWNDNYNINTTKALGKEHHSLKKKSSNLPERDNNKNNNMIEEIEVENLVESTTSTTTSTCIEEEGSSGGNDQLSIFSLLGRTICISWFGLSFLVCRITLSSGQAAVEHLVFLFFEILGSTYTMMGLTVILTVAFEIPIFHIAPNLLKKWGSGILLLVAAGCYIIRVIGYTLIPEGKVGWVLLFEPLHGVTFACSTTAGVDVIDQLTPRGYEATGQSLLQLLVGTGSIVGLLFGGWATETLGPRTMYRILAFVVSVGSLVFGSVVFLLDDAKDMNGNSDNTYRKVHQHEPILNDDIEMKNLTKSNGQQQESNN